MTDRSTPPLAAPLGALRASYGPAARSVRATRTVGLICIILGAAALVGGIVLALARDTGLLCLSVIGLALVVFGLWSVRRSEADASLRAALYEEGLLYSAGGAQEAYRWEDLSEVWQEVISREYRNAGHLRQTTHTYRLVMRDGRRLALDDRLQGIGELGEALQKAALPRLFWDALARYQRGETLAFGKLSLSREGLALGGRTLAWGDLGPVEVGDGQLYIAEAGRSARWAELPVHEVPNVFVLLALVQARQAGKL